MNKDHEETMKVIRRGNAFYSLEAELCGKTKEETVQIIKEFKKKWYPNK